ncbi:hypothetical protein CW749_17940 [Vibrio sp. vnigr-6D03]|uniref:hypothetical protein n=1 Tax=Vibrio sp. vnigr-6D03 TaxID=2058088 RepID=UPI000C32814A|nr:hypothetical protein [Vibrio sp. vnigr-6D03]PKF78094.1 hypothetical protein CW749_17940 [Vibrio sp. vnigr-6D03]
MGRTGYYNKLRKKERYSDTHCMSQLKATQALLKFCSEHGHATDEYIVAIASCAEALENKNIEQAVKDYQKVPLGGNNCFNDWYPPAVYEHETETYALAVFEALTINWSRLMALSTDNKT